MNIAISADSAIDLQNDLLKKYDIHVVPFTVTMDEEVKLDGKIDIEEMFAYCDKNKKLPKTSAVNEVQFDKHFKKLTSSYEAIIHFSLSSKMSSAYNNAVNSAKKFDNVYVIDSCSLSTGIALLAIYARELADKGLDVKEIVDKVEKRKPAVQASFVLDRLDYMKMGGRCSSVLAFASKMLCIHPHISVKDGTMGVFKKYMGTKMTAMVNKYCRETLTEFNHPDKHVIFITHSPCDQALVDTAKKWIENLGFENVYETQANATVSSHCGRNTIGILYMNDGEGVVSPYLDTAE